MSQESPVRILQTRVCAPFWPPRVTLRLPRQRRRSCEPGKPRQRTRGAAAVERHRSPAPPLSTEAAAPHCRRSLSPRASLPQPIWRLRWADEFSGTRLDARKWEAQLGNGSYYGILGWGNAERQTYTDRQVNLRVQGGHLIIQAQHEAAAPAAAKAVPGAASHPGAPYTSARIRTRGKFAVHPTAATPTVRIEARIRVPQGLGLWAAFWALPEDPNRYDTCSGCGAYGGWPASGELDIMEAANRMQMVSQHAACCA